jgi:hypothetical protein
VQVLQFSVDTMSVPIDGGGVPVRYCCSDAHVMTTFAGGGVPASL